MAVAVAVGCSSGVLPDGISGCLSAGSEGAALAAEEAGACLLPTEGAAGTAASTGWEEVASRSSAPSPPAAGGDGVARGCASLSSGEAWVSALGAEVEAAALPLLWATCACCSEASDPMPSPSSGLAASASPVTIERTLCTTDRVSPLRLYPSTPLPLPSPTSLPLPSPVPLPLPSPVSSGASAGGTDSDGSGGTVEVPTTVVGDCVCCNSGVDAGGKRSEGGTRTSSGAPVAAVGSAAGAAAIAPVAAVAAAAAAASTVC